MAAQRAILIFIGSHWIATFSESTKQLVDRWWNNTFQQSIAGVIQQAQIEKCARCSPAAAGPRTTELPDKAIR
jgi:hypothetical protein